MSVACYIVIVRFAYLPLTLSWHPYVAAILAFVTLLPASLFLGSWVTGLLIQPYCRCRPWEALLFSPGVALFGVCLYYWLPDRSPMFIAVMSGLGIAWLYVSTLGVMAGMAVRLRREAAAVAALEQEEQRKGDEHPSPSASRPSGVIGSGPSAVTKRPDHAARSVTEAPHRRAA